MMETSPWAFRERCWKFVRGSGIWLFVSAGVDYPTTHHCCLLIGEAGPPFAAGRNVDVVEADVGAGSVELSVVGA